MTSLSLKKAGEELPQDKGVYVLFLRCLKSCDVRVGSLGSVSLKEGVYAYVGSAFGGGGIKSRLGRHLKTGKKCRWHIDYIRRHMSVAALCYTLEGAEQEHIIADRFIASGCEVPMKGFGSSDCGCVSHLFYMKELPECFLPHHIFIK